LGSSFAGVKAGIIAGVFFVGSIGAFNYILLNILKASVLDYLRSTPYCTAVVPTNSTNTLENCFQATTVDLISLYVVEIFIVVLIFSFLFGRFFDRIPGKGYLAKSLFASYVFILVFVLFGFEGISTDITQSWFLVIFDVGVAGIFGYILGRFYKRYTRVVEFFSPDPATVRILVGGRNVAGRSMTFSNRSSHRVVAEASGKKLFREWSYSGGVTVEDPKSFETVMRVEGNGTLKASSTATS
jgi:hypothetical protein